MVCRYYWYQWKIVPFQCRSLEDSLVFLIFYYTENIHNLYWFIHLAGLIQGTPVNYNTKLWIVTLLIVCIIISIYNILQSLVGHGGWINEIRTQALKPSLLISASKVRKYTYFFNDFRLYGHALFFVFRLFQWFCV